METSNVYEDAHSAITELLPKLEKKLEQAVIAFVPEIEELMDSYASHIWISEHADMGPLAEALEAWDKIEAGIQSKIPGDIIEGVQRLSEAADILKREMPVLSRYVNSQSGKTLLPV